MIFKRHLAKCKAILWFFYCWRKKSCTRETLNLSTNVDSSTDFFYAGVNKGAMSIFFAPSLAVFFLPLPPRVFFLCLKFEIVLLNSFQCMHCSFILQKHLSGPITMRRWAWRKIYNFFNLAKLGLLFCFFLLSLLLSLLSLLPLMSLISLLGLFPVKDDND